MSMKHLSESYKSAQEVIRFMDTKTELTAGFAVALLGSVLVIFREVWVAGPYKQKQIVEIINNLVCLKFVFGLLILGTLAAGLASLASAIMAIVARPPKDGLPCTILFPYHDGSEKARRYFKEVISTLATDQIKAEYEDQLWKVGEILRKKTVWHRQSVYCLLAQIVCLAGAVGLFLYSTLTLVKW